MLNRVIAIALIAAYPLLVHVALVFAVPQLLFIAPMLFLAGVCWQGLVACAITAAGVDGARPPVTNSAAMRAVMSVVHGRTVFAPGGPFRM